MIVEEATVHGHAMRYRMAGRSGPVLVLIHGITSSSRTWEPVLDALGRSHRVIAPDLLGHGHSAKPRGDYSLGAYASGVRDLLAVLGHERATVVGHSLGGGIAMQFAYQFPERVERLALIGAGGLGKEVTPLLRAATLPGAELVLPVLTASWLRRGATTVGGLLARARVPLPEVVQEAFVGFGSMGDPGARAAFVHTARSVVDPFGQRVDARERLHVTAHLPLLVVWGRRDAVIPVAHGTALAQAVKGARLEVFERSGHFPHLTEPSRLARLLADWLATTPPAQAAE